MYQDIFLVISNTLSAREKTAEFANSIDPDEVAHNEPPHLDLHCLNCQLYSLDKNILKICRGNFVVICFLALKELTLIVSKSKSC